MWQSLYKTLRINPPLGTALPLPTSADLAAFEERYSVHLPEAYRSFALIFGPGEIARWFRVYVPTAGNESLADLAKLQESFTANRRILAHCFPADAAFFSRMVPFANTLNGDVIAWDPEDVTGGEGGEYGIYVIPRTGERVLYLVNSFRRFVEEACLGEMFARVMGYRDWEVSREFTPYGGGSRRAAAEEALVRRRGKKGG